MPLPWARPVWGAAPLVCFDGARKHVKRLRYLCSLPHRHRGPGTVPATRCPAGLPTVGGAAGTGCAPPLGASPSFVHT
jgi:hypothetical protein